MIIILCYMSSLNEAFEISSKLDLFSKSKLKNNLTDNNPVQHFPMYKCIKCNNNLTTTNDGHRTQFCTKCNYILLKDGQLINKFK